MYTYFVKGYWVGGPGIHHPFSEIILVDAKTPKEFDKAIRDAIGVSRYEYFIEAMNIL